MQATVLVKLSKLLQIQNQEEGRQHQVLAQIISKANLNWQSYIDQIEGGILEKLKDKVSVANLEQWLDLSVTLLSNNQCFDYAAGTGQTALIRFMTHVAQINSQHKYQYIAKLVAKHSSIPKCIVFHTLYAQHSVAGVAQKELPQLIPTFIRLSSFIIQQFLQLKNEPAKGSHDRVEDDKIIIDNCQSWVSNNIEIFYCKLPVPKQRLNRRIVLLSIGDIAGALMETQRQSIISRQITTKLMYNVLFAHVHKNYQWNQLHELFLKGLAAKKYDNPIKKIQIPEAYTQKCVRQPGLNTQAYAFFIINFVKNHIASLCSTSALVYLLGLVVAQLAARPYQIKIQAIFLLEQTVSMAKPIIIKNGFEGNYPIQLLFFSLFHYEHQKYQQIRSAFQFQNKEAEINSLAILKHLNLQNLNAEKDKYILKILSQQKKDKLDRTYLLVRQFAFKDKPVETQQTLLQICRKIKQKDANLAKELAIKWKKSVHSSTNQNIKQCLQKLLS